MSSITRPLHLGFVEAAFVAFAFVTASGCSGGGASSPATPGAPVAQQSVNAPAAGSAKMASTLRGSIEPYATVVKGDKPLVYYRLNETSGKVANDSSGNAHNGSYVGSPALGQPALIKGDPTSKSASFATGYVTENATWTQQAITAECWIKPKTADMTGSPRIIDNAWTDNNGHGFMMAMDNGSVKFWAGFSSIPSIPIAANKIYHLVGTYDANETPYTTHFYINGALVGQNWTQTPHPETGDSATTYLGVLNATSPGPGIVDYFQGSVSECAIYNHALTPLQVVTHYNTGAEEALAPPTPIPPSPPPSPPPTPQPLGSPIAYNADTACIYGKLYKNNILPAGEGEFATHGLDRTWWSRYRGDGTQQNKLGNWVSGLATSTWGRGQYNTYFGDENDGVSYTSDDPFHVGPDTGAPGNPTALSITAKPMPAHLIGNPQVLGEPYYAGMLFTPVNLKYGFIVSRVRTPAPTAGLSPAFWVLQGQAVKAGPHGNLSDEWDIQEMFGNTSGDGMNQGELIWNSAGAGYPQQNWGGSYGTLPGGGKASTDYHDYGVLLNKGGADISQNYNGPGGPGSSYGDPKKGGTFFFDGQPVYGHTGGADINKTATTPGYKEVMSMFQVSSGGWLGSPPAGSLPASYWMQWIRVYQPSGQSC